jgi:hypothetical protein
LSGIIAAAHIHAHLNTTRACICDADIGLNKDWCVDAAAQETRLQQFKFMHTCMQTRMQAEQRLVCGCRLHKKHGSSSSHLRTRPCKHACRLNRDWCVDATRAGNMAHLLNHSCDPNCLSRTISARHPRTGQHADHVVIFAKVRPLVTHLC